MTRRRHVRGALVAATAVAMTLVGCRSPEEPTVDAGSHVIARIEERAVLWQDFEGYLELTVGEDAVGLESAVLSALLDQYLEERLLVRLASDRDLLDDRQADSRRALAALLRERPPQEVTDEAVERYYREHANEFAVAERVELYQILVEEREIAERAREELAAGADFEEVARRVSVDPSAAWGGYQGELTRSDLPPALAETIFSLGEGEVSDIVEADYRFHLFQVERRLPAELLPLELAAPEIRDRLRTAATDRAVADLLAEARERYDVRIVEKNLPFRYRSSRAETES